jgi:hypothetical protein
MLTSKHNFIWSDFTIQHIKQFKNYNIPNSSNLLTLLKKERTNIKNSLSNISINIKPTTFSINTFINTSWVDKSISQETFEHSHLITWTFNNIIHYLYIKSNKQQFYHFCKYVKYIILIINYLNHNNKQVKIYIVFSSLKKYFPQNNIIINTPHVNTGYTDFNKNIIFIWRYEEHVKVIFHEIIHYFELDHHSSKINKLFNFTEAITDFWAILYHLIFLSLITKIKIKTLLQFEFAFIQNQAMKLHTFFKLNNWKNNIPNIKQKTPAFSYYIIKYLIFNYLINNDMPTFEKLINNILNIGFQYKSFIDIDSSRMTLLQII